MNQSLSLPVDVKTSPPPNRKYSRPPNTSVRFAPAAASPPPLRALAAARRPLARPLPFRRRSLPGAALAVTWRVRCAFRWGRWGWWSGRRVRRWNVSSNWHRRTSWRRLVARSRSSRWLDHRITWSGRDERSRAAFSSSEAPAQPRSARPDLLPPSTYLSVPTRHRGRSAAGQTRRHRPRRRRWDFPTSWSPATSTAAVRRGLPPLHSSPIRCRSSTSGIVADCADCDPRKRFRAGLASCCRLSVVEWVDSVCSTIARHSTATKASDLSPRIRLDSKDLLGPGQRPDSHRHSAPNLLPFPVVAAGSTSTCRRLPVQVWRWAAATVWVQSWIGACLAATAEPWDTQTVHLTARLTVSQSRRRDRQWLVSSASRLSR